MKGRLLPAAHYLMINVQEPEEEEIAIRMLDVMFERGLKRKFESGCSLVCLSLNRYSTRAEV